MKKQNGKFVLAAAVLAVMLLAMGSPAGAEVGIWNMDDTGLQDGDPVNNSGTYGDTLDGAIVGGAGDVLTKTTGYDSTANGAYNGFGSGEYINVDYNDVMNLNGSYIEFDCYIKAPGPSSDNTTNISYFIASRRFGGGLNNNKWDFYLADMAGADGYRLGVNTYSDAGTWDETIYDTFNHITWDPDQWYRVGFKVEDIGANTEKTVYFSSGDTLVDVANETRTSYNIGDATSAMSIGNQGGHASRYFNGAIDQVTFTPEPATMVLLGLGGVGMLIRRRRRHA